MPVLPEQTQNEGNPAYWTGNVSFIVDEIVYGCDGDECCPGIAGWLQEVQSP